MQSHPPACYIYNVRLITDFSSVTKLKLNIFGGNLKNGTKHYTVHIKSILSSVSIFICYIFTLLPHTHRKNGKNTRVSVTGAQTIVLLARKTKVRAGQ